MFICTNTMPVTTHHRQTAREASWPRYGLWLLGISVTVYVDLFEVAGLVIRPVQLVPILVALVVLPCLPSIRADVPRTYFVLPCLWACYMLVRHVAFDHAGQLTCARTLVNVTAYLASLILLLRSGRINWLLAGLLMGTLLSVVLALADVDLPSMVTSAVRMGNGRWQGLMPGANRFANLCAIASITGIGLLTLKGRPAFRLALAVATAGGLLGLAMSGSRGATLTTAISGIFLLWLTVHVKGRRFLTPRIIVFSTIALLVSFTMFTCFKQSIPERLVALIESPDAALAVIEDGVRRDLFEIAFDIFLESPVFGAGASAAIFTIPTRAGEIDISSHNMYLKLLSTSGVVGLIGYLALPMFILVRLGFPALVSPTRRADDLSFTPLALTWMVLILTHGIVISIGQTTHVWLLFAAMAYVGIQQTQRTTLVRFPKTHSRTFARPISRTRRPVPTTQRKVG